MAVEDVVKFVDEHFAEHFPRGDTRRLSREWISSS
jgi:hypothetical protein